MTSVEVAYVQYKDGTKIDGIKINGTKYKFSDYNGIKINDTYYILKKAYTISITVTNATASEDNPTTLKEGKTATLTFAADDGYNLPDSITVTGATLDSWDSETGTAVISNPTGNVTVTIVAEAGDETTPLAASSYAVAFESYSGTSKGSVYTETITLSGGTGEYSAAVSTSLITNGYASTHSKYTAGTITATVSGSTLTITLTITAAGSSEISGSSSVTVTSGDESVEIAVSVYYYCLTGDMLITMSDGTQKRVDSLTAGEKVLSFNPDTMRLEADEITYSDSAKIKTYMGYDIWRFSDGTEIKTVRRHRFYNFERGGMVNLDEWHIGEHTYRIDGQLAELTAHENVKERARHYTLFTKNQNYFVNGLLSGNKYTKDLKLKWK